MNVDEARVPDVDANWSIEIFLFSNGQQYSPPRKYYLRADELSSWEDTLNYLATAHYGLRCPQISLYTTAGQLVEGPLGLNGGHAYVAVVEPDRFVDTGYQKYLIRASRSWEKRQARKKVSEYVPGDQCCLCPEKEWCCDPQTCCECPEIEDSCSQYSLLPATGHPELRPAGGHFMSSASTKPVVTGDYGPRSGRIGPITREHEVSSGEYRTNPVEYGYSPVPAPAKPDQYGAILSVNGANTAEQAPTLSVTEPRPAEYTAKSDEFEPNLDENAGRPGKYEVNLSDHAARLNESVAEPSEYGAKLNEHEFRLSQNGEIPVEYVARLIENEPCLSNDVVKLNIYGARPDKYVPGPVDYEKRPSQNGARLDESGMNPGEYGATPNKNVAKPGEHETKPSRNGVRNDEYRARPGEYKTKPIGKGATPNRNEARPGEHGARPGEYKTRPSINRAKPKEYVPGASEYGPRSSAIRAQPSEYGTKSGEYAARLSEYETRSSVNRVRPAEINRERLDDIKRVKPGDSGARSGKNEVLSGEAEIRHIRRINGKKGTEIQQGGRTVEPRVGEQKGREINLAGRTGGQRVGDNGARLSEQSNKQHYLSPKLGGRGSKLGAQEELPGDHGLRTIDQDTSSGIPPSRLPESSARTALVSRPSPRDRINSRVRTSELGQPQSRTFTRVDGTTALLDDSEIKNTVGHPGARPVSAGKTAVSGASHISEAQQHARKSNLFAGRPSTEKKRLPIGSTLLKQPTLISSVFRKLEDQQPIKTKEEILTKKTNEIASVACVPASSAVVKSKIVSKCTPSERTTLELPLPTIFVTNLESPTTKIAHRENNIDENDELTVSTNLDFIEHVVDSIDNSPKETQTEIIYVGKSSAYDSINVEVQTHTDTKQHAQETPASNKAKVNSDAFQFNTDVEDTKQPAQEESASNKAKVDPDAFQTSTDAEDTKQHAQEGAASNKVKADSDTFQYNTDAKQHAQEESATNNVKVDSDMFQTSTETVDTKLNAQEESASNKVKADSDTLQYSTDVEDTKQHAQEESATNKAKIDSDMFQTSTETVDAKLNAQEESAGNKAKVDSVTCCLCSQREQKLAIVDPDENTIAILYQGDRGTINLKLDIKIQNIVKSDYSCHKNCQGAHSIRNMTSDKESQISIEDIFLSRQDSLHSLFHKSYSLGYGFSQFSPNVMVVQCAGCGRLNSGGCDPPQCCDNNKQYFVLLTNSLNEDMNDNCNCNPPCCPSDLCQLQLKKQSCIIPVKKSCSNMTSDTITTVTVSGVPLQNRCIVKTSPCQTEESHECMMSKHKVSITEELVTTPTTSEIQKKSSSSIPTLDVSAKRSRLKICEEICPEIKENYSSLVCSRTDPVPCQKVPLACTKVSAPTTCPKAQPMGCQQTCPPVQTQGCSSVSSTCPTCNPGPLACIQIQTRVCPHGPQVSNKETQTQWRSLVLQARLHCDGRYSFHLPPLNVLNNFPF